MKRVLLKTIILITSISLTINANNDIVDVADGHLRIGYQHTNIASKAGYSDASIGGKIGLQTQSLYDIKAGITLYTTNAINLHEGNGVPFFDVDNRSYTIIGESYLLGEWDHSVLKIGRQEINTPFADADDKGMVPNTFEAVTYLNTALPDTMIILTQLQKMSGVGAESPSHFSSLNSNNGVQVAGITYEGIKNISLTGWHYHLHHFEIDSITYLEANYKNMLDEWSYTFGVQYAIQSYLANTDAVIYGLNTSLTSKPLDLTLDAAYNKNVGNSASNGFGGGPFFTNSEHLTLNESGENGEAFRLSAEWNAKMIGIEKLNLSTGFFWLKNQSQSKATEFDIVANYTPSQTLDISIIYSDIDDKINGNTFVNLRIFVNYHF